MSPGAEAKCGLIKAAGAGAADSNNKQQVTTVIIIAQTDKNAAIQPEQYSCHRLGIVFYRWCHLNTSSIRQNITSKI